MFSQVCVCPQGRDLPLDSDPLVLSWGHPLYLGGRGGDAVPLYPEVGVGGYSPLPGGRGVPLERIGAPNQSIGLG